jgi:hypothetical protein
MITNKELLVFSVSHFNMYIEDASNKPSNKIKSLYNSLRGRLRDEIGKSMSERGYFSKHDKEVDLMWNIYNHLEKNIGVQSMSTANKLIKEIA